MAADIRRDILFRGGSFLPIICRIIDAINIAIAIAADVVAAAAAADDLELIVAAILGSVQVGVFFSASSASSSFSLTLPRYSDGDCCREVYFRSDSL